MIDVLPDAFIDQVLLLERTEVLCEILNSFAEVSFFFFNDKFLVVLMFRTILSSFSNAFWGLIWNFFLEPSVGGC